MSGAPGSGKTTLAGPLARELGLPLFAKDSIKEKLHDVLGTAGDADLEWSSRLGAASMELLWHLAANAPACLMEANFLPQHERQRLMLRELSTAGRLVEVYCTCPPDVAARRYAERELTSARHRVHVNNMPPHVRALYSGPLRMGPVVEVDTTTTVDIAKIAQQVAHELAL